MQKIKIKMQGNIMEKKVGNKDQGSLEAHHPRYRAEWSHERQILSDKEVQQEVQK